MSIEIIKLWEIFDKLLFIRFKKQKKISFVFNNDNNKFNKN